MFAVISRSDANIANDRDGFSLSVRDPAMQRAFGTLDLVFQHKDGQSRASRIFQEGAMKVRFPRALPGEMPEAVLLNTAGGLTGGDRMDVSVSLGEGAAGILTTQACEKIYRSPGDDAVIMGRLAAGKGARMEWLPQPAIFFDGARLKRETHVEMAQDASLLAVEAVIFGRTARGEEVTAGALSDAWFVRRGERLIHADRFRIAGDMKAELERPGALGGSRAMATIRYIAQDAVRRLEHMRSLLGDDPLSAASAWNGMLIARVIAADGFALQRKLLHVLGGFRGAALPRVWSL